METTTTTIVSLSLSLSVYLSLVLFLFRYGKVRCDPSVSSMIVASNDGGGCEERAVHGRGESSWSSMRLLLSFET
uniref:Putative secreted peptide n=1 Tax=Anopheles braziliensis TaxID=58242 RepID=A0A2M3ZMR5_9DIPT